MTQESDFCIYPDQAKLLVERIVLARSKEIIEDNRPIDTLTADELKTMANDERETEALYREIGMLCRGDGTALLLRLASAEKFKDNGKHWIGPDGKPTKTSPLFRMQSEAKGKHVMHEVGTGRTWAFSPELSDSIGAITDKIRGVLKASMPAGGVFLRNGKKPIYASTDVACGVYVNWGIHRVLNVRHEYNVKAGRERWMIGHDHSDATREVANRTTLASLLSKNEQEQFAKSGPFLFSFAAGYRADFDPAKGKRKLDDDDKEVSKNKRRKGEKGEAVASP